MLSFLKNTSYEMSTFYAALDGVNPQPEHDPLQGGGPQGEAKNKSGFPITKTKFYNFFKKKVLLDTDDDKWLENLRDWTWGENYNYQVL